MGFAFEPIFEVLDISHNQSHGLLEEKIRRDRLDLFFGLEQLNLERLATILRLADILDFDSSRTPTILFHHLGLDLEMQDRWQQLSKQEWRKHLVITGIQFQESERKLTYRSAACPDPATENAIRHFVKLIQAEVSHARLEVTKIQSVEVVIHPAKGDDSKDVYTYRDWSFHLQHQEIVQLLMGQSLYGDPLGTVPDAW